MVLTKVYPIPRDRELEGNVVKSGRILIMHIVVLSKSNCKTSHTQLLPQPTRRSRPKTFNHKKTPCGLPIQQAVIWNEVQTHAATWMNL